VFSVALACCSAAGVAQAQSPSAVDWSGFYIGAGVGAVAGQSDTTALAQPSGSSYFLADSFDQVAESGNGSLSQWRPAGGIQVGYRKQLGHFLVGIEAGANSLALDDSRSAGQFYIAAPANQFVIRHEIEADWQATLLPHLGWAQDNWSATVSAGLAITEVRAETTFTDDSGPGAFGRDSTRDVKLGWAVGLNGEYALDGNWSLRGGYLYTDFGNTDTSPVVTNAGAPGLSNVIDSSVDLRTHTILIGLTYRFNSF
jgi:opacity protein-like surface antigen